MSPPEGGKAHPEVTLRPLMIPGAEDRDEEDRACERVDRARHEPGGIPQSCKYECNQQHNDHHPGNREVPHGCPLRSLPVVVRCIKKSTATSLRSSGAWVRRSRGSTAFRNDGRLTPFAGRGERVEIFR